MVQYNSDNGGSPRIVDESLKRQIERLANNSKYILGVPRAEVGENMWGGSNRKAEYFMNMSWSGIDHDDINEYPMRTVCSITIEQREGEPVHNVLVRPVVIEDEGLERKMTEIMEHDDFHKGPNHVDTVYDSIALHYHHKGEMDRSDVIEIIKNAVDAFEVAVKFALDNR